ncbi:TPA: cytidylyltransferase domain-containing protein [Campylobacter jejuni]
MKVIAMIPARLGSQRVRKKNLRLIDGKPLISYIIKTVSDTCLFDEIYLNSEADIFEKIAIENGIKFYKRPIKLSSNTATNDEFAYDFMKNINGDILIQILPTSPLLTSEEIISFVRHMLEYDYDTLISVKHEQIACIYKDTTLNFDRFKVNPPSQEMEPVKAYATALMGWKYDNFKRNIERFKSAYHGGDGKIGYFELRGLSTIDIDREEDFLLAEAIITAKKNGFNLEKKYYDEE